MNGPGIVRPPAVSVIVPAYSSEGTIERCIEALRAQTFRDFEVIVVDSSLGGATADLVRAHGPEVRLVRSERRLLPHGARNLGAGASTGELLVFTDPDIYPDPDWLERLTQAHRASGGGPVVGAFASHGRRWLDVGSHLVKFDMWLPGGGPRSTDLGPTGNLLLPRRLFAEVGPFPADIMLGDAVLSWRLGRSGVRLRFAPDAVVHHDHRTTWRELLSERWSRGRELARLRVEWEEWSPGRIGVQLLASLVPVRLVKLVRRRAVNARRAGRLAHVLWTLPVLVTAEIAWLLGESVEYAAMLTRPHQPASCLPPFPARDAGGHREQPEERS